MGLKAVQGAAAAAAAAPAAGDAEDGGIVKVVGELLRIQRGGGDEDFDVRPKARDVLDQPEQHICVQRALVRLVDHHHAALHGRQGIWFD